MRNKPVGAAVYGVDIGKTRFDVAGLDAGGAVVQRLKFRRETLLAFFAAAPAATVGMEACPGSQWLARRLQALGHNVRIIPAQFVKPYVKSNKNDVRDAEAIAEATTRPTMRFVEVKTPDQVDAQALHRVREREVKNRTAMINQMRGLCLEHGVALREGAGVFKRCRSSAPSTPPSTTTSLRSVTYSAGTTTSNDARPSWPEWRSLTA